MKKTTLLLAAAWMLLLLFVPISMHATSPARTVDIYQTNTSNVTQILYDYPETITGNDNLEYGLVDMGYGVIWADRNVGASSKDAHGGWFQWGGTDDLTTYVTTNQRGPSSGGIDETTKGANYQLRANEDAATAKMGTEWHIPSQQEWNDLIKYTNTNASERTFTSKVNNTKVITLPAGGYYYSSGSDKTSYAFYWTSSIKTITSGNNSSNFIQMLRNNNEFIVDIKDPTYPVSGRCVMPIRAVYSPTNTHTLTIAMGDYQYKYICENGQQITVTIYPDTENGKYFKWWSDNHSLTNATRTFVMTSDIEVRAIVLKDESVNVYENISENITKILYALSPQIGKDGKTYIPVDLGYGVAWADRNVGADGSTYAGGYFYWGGTIATTTFNALTGIDVSQYQDGYTLTAEQDAATVNMGTSWRIPTDDEWIDMRNGTTLDADGGTFKNKQDASKSIFLPASGYYNNGYNGRNGSLQQSGNYHFYWSSVLKYLVVGYTEGWYPWIYENWETNNAYTVALTINNNYLSETFGMPIRAIYSPDITTKTLTITINGYTYQYICEEGQEVTVTANATTESYVFDEWKMEDGTTTDATDTHLATRTFTMTDNITRTATFKQAPTGSTVSIIADNTEYGSVDESEITNVEDGATITIDGNTLTIGTTTVTATPTAADALYTYTFTGWYNDATEPATQLTGNTNTVTDDITITAHFTRTLDLYDNRDDATYYNNIKALNGQTYDVTYHRSVAYTSDNGNARWYTLCLPFDVDQSQLDINGLTGKVYEYRYAEGSADENDHVTFHFRAVKSPGYMHAGQGYLVKATGNMGPDFTFTGVTLDTDKDTETNVNALKTNSANAYKESGDIAIVGVLRNGTLHAVGKQVMGLANNKIWYPHTNGNPMPAYRAYFYNPNASASVTPRVRIVVEGEGTTELEVVDGELISATEDSCAPRKYIRNGVLIIERNGVRYDAQGRKM